MKVKSMMTAAAFLSALSAGAEVSMSFGVGGQAYKTPVTDITVSNFEKDVTVKSSKTKSPVIIGLKNRTSLTTGVSGSIRINVRAMDRRGGNFMPTTWSGGTEQGSIHGIASGWGVSDDMIPNGAIQAGEALILTFDLSGLTLPDGASVILKRILFFEENAVGRNGSIWLRDPKIEAGKSGAAVRIAKDIVTFSGNLAVTDGMQLALTRGTVDTRLLEMDIDIVQR